VSIANERKVSTSQAVSWIMPLVIAFELASSTARLEDATWTAYTVWSFQVWAVLLFLYAALPHRKQRASLAMMTDTFVHCACLVASVTAELTNEHAGFVLLTTVVVIAFVAVVRSEDALKDALSLQARASLTVAGACGAMVSQQSMGFSALGTGFMIAVSLDRVCMYARRVLAIDGSARITRPSA
jgi:hypothetical protein